MSRALKKLILQNYQSPGDLVMLTAAVRELHRCYPDQFITDVRTSCPALWEHNPYITAIDDDDPDATVIDSVYPLIHRSNQSPYHFIHGFIHHLNEVLDLRIDPGLFQGDVYVSDDERSWMSQVEEVAGLNMPFWIIDAGGKFDYTTKWWPSDRYQQVVDAFRGRILFVQIGERQHYHPKLEGVMNLVGQTDLRQLIRLMYHARGVLTPVSLPMHLAAAVPMKRPGPPHRPCVVVAGGREPSQWEAYPHHQFLHTNGALACCDNGGCWKSRTLPLGDGDDKDKPEHLCVDVVNQMPRCMDLISAEIVIDRIELYHRGGVLRYLDDDQSSRAAAAIQPSLTAV